MRAEKKMCTGWDSLSKRFLSPLCQQADQDLRAANNLIDIPAGFSWLTNMSYT